MIEIIRRGDKVDGERKGKDTSSAAILSPLNPHGSL